MLQVARDCTGRDTSFLSFGGDFCILENDLRQCIEKDSPPKIINHKAAKEEKRKEKIMSKESQKCEVFLGGSCNPTTWRQDTAIPMLNRHGISFYNPQVAHWDKTLIEKEHNAKINATVLFFVLDRSTRNVSSIVEAAYLAACRRKLVIVMDSYAGAGQLINGEAISQLEYEELTSAFATLRCLAERQSIPVFTQISQALMCTARILRGNIWSDRCLSISDKISLSRQNHYQLAEKLARVDDSFPCAGSIKITLAEACVVFKVVTGRDLRKEEIRSVVAAKKGLNEANLPELPVNDVQLNFEEFCCIVSEFEKKPFERRKIWQMLSHSLISPIQNFVEWALPRKQTSNGSCEKDVYLGGPSDLTSRWREHLAIPVLQNMNLSYCVPNSSYNSPLDVSLIEKCNVILFVIESSSRAVSELALANYFIGLKKNIVLCIQMLSQGVSVNGDQLSSLALKDYNRGRSYLSDQAKKEGIPVFSEIKEAIECAVSKCKSSR